LPSSFSGLSLPDVPIPALPARPLQATPTATAAAPTEVAASVSATPTLSLGGHYIQKSYSFHNTNDKYTEIFRIDNQSWALVYTVTPLSDDTAAGWFELTITNVDSKRARVMAMGKVIPAILSSSTRCTAPDPTRSR